MLNMNTVDSDLEEGEIPDDSPSSPCNSDKKDRELPRRYIVQEPKDAHVHKHKKDCKYAVHHHPKKIKLKKSPAKKKDSHKTYHKPTCSRDKPRKRPNRYGLIVDKNLLSQSLIAEIKGSLKRPLTGKQNTPASNFKSEKNMAKSGDNRTSNDNSCLSEKGITNVDKVPKDTNLAVIKQPDQHLTKVVDKLTSNVSNDSPKVENEDESEDEEELRKIALATFMKRKAVIETPVITFESADNSNPPESESLVIIKPISHSEASNLSDNYEVVDMDLGEDDDSENSAEKSEKVETTKITEKLYVIDTKPTTEEIGKDSSSELPIPNNSSDEDFEADLLRAQLIDNMYRKKCLQNKVVEEMKPSNKLPLQQLPQVPKKNDITNYEKPNTNFFFNHSKSIKRIVRKSLINKHEKLLPSTNKSNFPKNQLEVNHKPAERLIIALNEESSSSSDESDDSADKPIPENPVASIEALISDCRQKSEASGKTEAKPIPKAVSCLSKAQQEEYNTLMKILAEKEKLPPPSEVIKHKNGSLHSPLSDLKLLEEKLRGFKGTLLKKKLSLAQLSKEVNSKKLLYLKSKLSAQHLREQYLAADKVRKASLCEWSKTVNQLKNVKKNVSNLEKNIIQTQHLCSKLGASIQGQTHNLPSFPTNNNNPNM